MPTVAETARLLEYYGDLVRTLALLPMITHIRFQGLLQTKEINKLSTESDSTEADDKKDVSKSATSDKPRQLPSAWALLFLVLAEVCASTQFFDPSDRQVRRAVGEMVRTQGRASGGFAQGLALAEKLMTHEDVYELVRFVATYAGYTSLFVLAFFGLDKLYSEVEVNPFTSARKTIVHIARALIVPRFWLPLLLAIGFVLGRWSPLAAAIRNSRVLELIRTSTELFRALALTGIVIGPHARELVAPFATLQCVGAFARIAHVLVQGRVPFASLLDHGPFDTGVSATFIGARGTVGIEVWCILILLPFVFRQRKFAMLLPVLAVPCIAVLAGEPYASFVDPYSELLMKQLPNLVAIVSLLTIFLGGFPTMILCLTMCQLLIRIHKLDKVRF
mmetsp:Transcript_93826/g.186107  ORF Transcript_93826/g.186107 Transcript_93826/m.186107 type:complete len:391 (+) Transcript_93826:74-1246(+)